MNITLAVCITFIRILLTPVIIGCILFQSWQWASILFVLAVITDFLDGFVARRFQQESRFGQLLDPIADKILIMSLMYVLFGFNSNDSNIAIFGWFFIAKEIILLVGAAALYFTYDHFFKPTLFSRFVSVSEMFIIFNILATRALFSIFSHSLLSEFRLYAMFLGFWLYVTIFCSCVLILQYVVLVILFLRKRQ